MLVPKNFFKSFETDTRSWTIEYIFKRKTILTIFPLYLSSHEQASPRGLYTRRCLKSQSPWHLVEEAGSRLSVEVGGAPLLLSLLLAADLHLSLVPGDGEALPFEALA